MKIICSIIMILLFFLDADAQRKNKHKTLEADTIPIGRTYSIKSYFQFYADYDIEEEKQKLHFYYDTLAVFINKHPTLIFAIEVHTDCRADSMYNRAYSQRCADSIVATLFRHGADSSRIRAVGKGEDELLIPKCKCELSDREKICTEVEHQQNRRTLLKVIGIADQTKQKRKKSK